MASLKDVAFSLNGEQPQSEVEKLNHIAGMVKYDKKNPTAVEEKDWYLFKLKDNTKQGGVYIPNIDDVVNPTTGDVERIRLLAGVKSIWLKDQKELTESYIRQNRIDLHFARGQKMMRVAKHNKSVLEFLRLCNSNLGNPNRLNGTKNEFFEYDSAAAERDSFAREEFELEMAIAAKQAKPEEMRKHASFLGIRMINDTGERKSDDGVRREYVIYAKRNPHYFKQTMGTEQLEVSWLVKKAISETLIDIGREPGKIFWSSGGGMICVLPQSSNAQDYLTELAMTNSSEGKDFKSKLQKIVT